ncbi:hypothetical protein [Streptomyces sp. 8L]|uniref:hypothetical protein n=1 Tax=Streptomyces sp. 8L TaxID=2877242 RepID=UPI001CD1FE7D|nr:hypothetical protein [Streptomyces sp. 8L]MCA1223236.1 hypothetical protein [Streptomyces sp. 8L]
MTSSSQPNSMEPLHSFAVAQDGTLHFTVRARDLDHAYERITSLEASEAVADVALGDGVQLTHITYGDVDSSDIRPADTQADRPALQPAIGSQMVVEATGISPQRLGKLHRTDSPEDTVAWLVIVAARHLDQVHEQLTDTAQYAASTLTRVAESKAQIDSLGVLQNSATQINILAARRTDAVERLKEVIHVYRRVTALDNVTPQRAHHPGQAPPPPAAPSAPPNGVSPRQ